MKTINQIKKLNSNQTGRYDDRFFDKEVYTTYLESQRLKSQLYRDNKKNEANKIELENLKTTVGKAKFITRPNGCMTIDVSDTATMTQEIYKYNENDIDIEKSTPTKVMTAYLPITTANINYYLLQIFRTNQLIVV